jgi:Alginate lyase
MNPNLEFGQAIRGRNTGRGSGIIDSRPLISVVQGMSFLERRPEWDRNVSEGMRSWFRSYMEWLTTSEKGLAEKKSGNNHATWWAAQVAAYAGFTRDPAVERMVWDWFRSALVPNQLRPDGSAPREEARTRSLSYSAFNLDAFTLLCRLAQNAGVDLWRYRTEGSGSVDRAVAYIAPFAEEPEKWRKQQISTYTPRSNFFLGLAGIGLSKPEYVAAQKRLGLPRGAWGEFLALLLATY